MRILLNKPDTFGAFASAMCMLHCLVTPLLFIVHTCAVGGCSTTPTWWSSIDFLFLIVSFFAIHQSVKTTFNKYVKNAFWISWAFLFIIIINENLQWIYLPEFVLYVPAIALIVLHVYNLNYCQCETNECCVNNG